MSNWILYDDFVDRVRDYHHTGFSGLITGVSDSQHSFQIGFDQGQIVLMSYRIKKGLAALQLIAQIERAKITEHANSDIKEGGEVPDTSTILSRLTANTLDDTNPTTDISDVPAPPPPKGSKSASGSQRAVDSGLKKTIETAAIHHFGPIGAMVCEEHLSGANGDVRSIMLKIAQDVGASEADTKAFFQSVSSGR
ncbi:MAG: hypothetical protein AAF353_17550 [Pseudomonadota bacterium]